MGGTAALLATLAVSSAFGAPAAPAPRELTYEEAARIALGQNPDLMSLRYQGESQMYRARQAMAPNNPSLTLAKNDIPGLSPTSIGGSTVYTLSWTLGFPGKALSQGAAGRHQAESLREQSSAKEIDLLVGLSNNYVSLASNERMSKFLAEELAKNEQLVKLLEKKYAAAQAAQADLLNARVVVANANHDIIDNKNERATLLTQFRNLIKKPGEERYAPLIPDQIVIPKLTLSLEELTATMQRNRHQLKAAHRQVEAAQAAFTNASLQPLPDLNLSAAMNVFNVPSAEPVNVARDYSVSLGVAIPLFFPFNELSGIQAAGRDRDSAEAQEDSQRLQAMADLQTAYVSFQAAQKVIEDFTKVVLPAAKSSYDLTRTTYSLGKADYFILNEARKVYVQAQKDMLAKQVAAAQFFNQIVQQVGCDVTNKEGPDACQ